MKTSIKLLLLLPLILCGNACKKNGPTKGTNDPARINVYFDFIGSGEQPAFKEGDVEISVNLMKTASGELINPGGKFSGNYAPDWYPSKTLEHQGKLLFGPVDILLQVEEDIRYKGQPLTGEYFYMYRFGGADQDTVKITQTRKVNENNLVVHDITNIYYNNRLVATSWDDDKPGEPFIISIKK